MIDLNALMIFAKVAETGSFSETARQMSLPLSTISRKVAALESTLGVRLLERSTRSLRLTDIGAEIFAQAQRGSDVGEAVEDIASNTSANPSATLRLSVPPNISDTFLVPLIAGFQAEYPNIRVKVLVTDRYVDLISEGVDVAIRVAGDRDSALIKRTILTYRHQLLASPAYLAKHGEPTCPDDLLQHRLIAFSYWSHERSWVFLSTQKCQTVKQRVSFDPHLELNDFAGVAAALAAGGGIGDLPPICAPHFVSAGQLVEVMPEWHFPTINLSLVHLGKRHMSRAVRLFNDYAAAEAPKLFPDLPA